MVEIITQHQSNNKTNSPSEASVGKYVTEAVLIFSVLRCVVARGHQAHNVSINHSNSNNARSI